MQSILRSAISVAAAAGLLALPGCGGSDNPSSGETSTGPLQEAPAASAFPKPDGKSIDEILAAVPPSADRVISPSGIVFRKGEDRFGFAVFDLSRAPISDDQVAIYAAPKGGGPAQGPYPARVESLETDPAFTAQTTANDPDAAKVVYVTTVDFNKNGPWDLIGVIKDGDSFTATRIPGMKVGGFKEIPDIGDKAPVVHTPTLDDVADVSEIDTREPPSSMHDVDLADALGKEPVVLVFATPRLCQSRVCGPVVDVAEQVKAERPDDAAFIHMEIYNDNSVDKGLRPQVQAYGLQTEPWTFVIDADGVVSSVFEGAISVDELNQALDTAVGA